MYSGEMLPHFGDQDLLGGVAMGEYRQGRLPDGYKYRFEATGIQKNLDISREGKNVLAMWSRDQEGVLLALPERTGVFYNQDGKLGWASLYVNQAIWEAQRQGKISLPQEVVDNVRNQRLNGVEWMVTMNFNSYEPMIFFNQPGVEAGSPYELKFDQGWRYPIPGVGWGVGVIRNGDMVGFEVVGVDGVGQKFWFNRSVDFETLPTEENVAGLRVDGIIGVLFPGFELARA